VLVNNDTAEYNLVFYAVASGSTTPPQASQIKAIFVMTGTWHFADPDSAESEETLAAYLPDGDPEHNLLPAPDAVPFLVQSFGPHPQHRIPMP